MESERVPTANVERYLWSFSACWGQDSSPALIAADLLDARQERDAYRKAKAENDERYMTERDEARRERDEAHARVTELEDLLAARMSESRAALASQGRREYEVLRDEEGTRWALVTTESSESPARAGTPISVWRFCADSWGEAMGWYKCLQAVYCAERQIPTSPDQPQQEGSHGS